MPRLNFAPNITRTNSRWPPTVSWDSVCAARGTMSGDYDDRSLRQERTSHGPGSSGIARLVLSLADPSSAQAFTARLERDLAARKVLCDVKYPCTASVHATARLGLIAEVCLPPPSSGGVRNSSGAHRPVVCEPYGEMWQQYARAQLTTAAARLLASTLPPPRIVLEHRTCG